MQSSDMLSLFAIIVSILTFGINIWYENKRLKRESDAKFFQDIYFKYMKEKIPKTEANISFNSTTKKMDGIQDMVSLMQNLRKETIPYKFIDKNFFDILTKKLMDMEDFFTESLSQVYDSDRFESFKKESTTNISELYQILNKKFQNKKLKSK